MLTIVRWDSPPWVQPEKTWCLIPSCSQRTFSALYQNDTMIMGKKDAVVIGKEREIVKDVIWYIWSIG